MYIFQFLCAILIGIVTIGTCCDDVDSDACRRMSISRPDLCSDDNIRKAACPKFCDVCPKVCYFCNGTLSDKHLCTSTITCQWDEFCDDPWQGMNIFGKRDLTSRDVSVTCCDSDFCNHPNTTTTTTTREQSTTKTTTARPTTTTPGCSSCCKDLMILLDVSGSMSESYVKRFLRSVVTALPISSSGLLASVVVFSYQAKTIFDIGDHMNKTETLEAINSIQFERYNGYMKTGVDYLLNHTLISEGGDRPDFPNIVLVITDDTTPISYSKARELHSKVQRVIVVQIGHTYSANLHLASSQAYNFHVIYPSSLNTIDASVAQLICN